MGLTRASEPTLEKPEKQAYGRTAYLSFGLEGINNPVPGSLELVASREDLTAHLLTFLWAEPMVELPDVMAHIASPADLIANVGFAMTGDFHTADIVAYRWDFGDGSPIVVTTEPTVSHVYADTGTYTARVEVTDFYGHKAVAHNMVTVTMFTTYLPILVRDS